MNGLPRKEEEYSLLPRHNVYLALVEIYKVGSDKP